jgi:hypothetical protein
MGDSDKMTSEAFRALVDQVESRARIIVRQADLVREHSNKALDRLAERDPGLVALLKRGIDERGRNSEAVLRYIESRRETKNGG